VTAFSAASLLCAGKLTDAQDHLQRVANLYAAPSGGHHSLLFRRDPQVLARVKTGACAQSSRLRGPSLRGGSVQLRNGSIIRCWDHRVLGRTRCVVSIALMRRDLAAAEAAITALSDWADRMNATLWKMMGTIWKGKLRIERGEFARGIELISPTLEACERTGWQLGYAQFLSFLAEGLAGA